MTMSLPKNVRANPQAPFRPCRQAAASYWDRKSRVDFFVELIDDFGGSVLRHAYAISGAGLEARHEIAHNWGVRQHFQRRRGGYP
jgi:hypothetical protein